jgi:cob(I)alamin adenosyltransferase
MIILYTGNGKGKTSAALGTVLRSVGYGKKSCIIQYIKDGSQYGEHHSLEHHLKEFVDVFQTGKGFYKLPGDKYDEIDHLKAASEALIFSKEMIVSGKYDLIVLDEIITAVMAGLLKENDAIELMKIIPDKMHLLMTGRGATEKMIENADLVTDMQEIKHPFSKDQSAVKGVDY